MKKEQPPEDTPEWKDVGSKRKPVTLLCRICGCQISVWHCADAGCGWCARCGEDTVAKGKR